MASHRILEYLVRSDRTVLEIHGEWDRFASANHAPEMLAALVVGRSLDGFVAGAETRLIYHALMERVLQTGEPIHFEYRCDSPGLRRFMSMEMDLAAKGVVRFRSRSVREEPRDPQRLLDATERRAEDILSMCSWCKRVRTGDGWVEVEDYVEQSGVLELEELPRLTHGVCPSCESDMDSLVGAA